MCIFTGGIISHLAGKLVIIVQFNRLFPGHSRGTRPGPHKTGVLRFYIYIFDHIYGVVDVIFNVIQIRLGPGIYDIHRYAAGTCDIQSGSPGRLFSQKRVFRASRILILLPWIIRQDDPVAYAVICSQRRFVRPFIPIIFNYVKLVILLRIFIDVLVDCHGPCQSNCIDHAVG